MTRSVLCNQSPALRFAFLIRAVAFVTLMVYVRATTYAIVPIEKAWNSTRVASERQSSHVMLDFQQDSPTEISWHFAFGRRLSQAVPVFSRTVLPRCLGILPLAPTISRDAGCSVGLSYWNVLAFRCRRFASGRRSADVGTPPLKAGCLS